MERFFEIDLLRGIALVLMVFFHLMFTLYYFGISDMSPLEGWLYWVGRISGFLFVFIVGVSLALSYLRTERKASWIKYFARGAYIIGLGMFVTIVTIGFFPSAPILFGVLHLIGTSIILSFPFLKFTWQNVILGIVLITIGIFLGGQVFDFWYLLPLGFAPHGFASLDYYPLLPWFGVVLLGTAAGNIFYPNYRRNFKLPEIQNNPLISFITFLGRNTLLIYFLHEPIILLLILLLTVLI
ncbi:MAG: heparan-alpha-glucosaminide N-acetyltransferase [Candidatus Micrarchaeia archaeon]